MTTKTRHDTGFSELAQVGPRTVLVAIRAHAPSSVALRRGHALAQIMGARLFVVHVLRRPSWLARLRSPEKSVVPRETLLAAAEEIRAFCEHELGPGAEQPPIVLKVGRTGKSILEAAREFGAVMIVLGDSRSSRSRVFTSAGTLGSVIRGAWTPVLVARPERGTNEIVAATNFADERFPALSHAARLGARLRSHVTFVHNLEQSAYAASTSVLGMPVSASMRPLPPDLDRKQWELEEVAHFIGTNIDAIVVSQDRASEAILAVARRVDADLVVVGSRPRAHALPLGLTGTALAVACDAQRSVLTVPLGRGESARWVS